MNLITLSADLKAGASSLTLLSGVDARWLTVPLAAAVVGLLLVGSYQRVRAVLQIVALAFLTYVVAAFAARPNWGTVLHDSLVPSLHLGGRYSSGALALLGTTLTSYVYVWETIELSEERKRQPPRWAQVDAIVGAFCVVVVFWFILVATGATLGVRHHEVQTAEDAARALRPVAGQAASGLFGAGLLASATLALPVLAATSAHLLASQRGWPRGLSRRPREAPGFYAALTLALAIATAISFLGISAIHLLFYASIAGGVATPVSLAFLMLIAGDRSTMRRHAASRPLLAAGWTVAVIVTAFGALALASG